MRWVLLTALTLGCVLTGLPATSASAAAGGLITGTVTFHEPYANRTLQVYRQTGDVWAPDASLQTVVDADGSYSVHVPAGVPVELRVSYGSPDYAYFYGDGFGPETATPVTASAGQTIDGIDLDVPAPAFFSGRLLDRSGQPTQGTVIPTANTTGIMLSTVAEPIPVDSTGVYSVILPAGHEDGVMGTDTTGNEWGWLGGGTGNDPDWYINPTAGEERTGQDIKVPIGATAPTVAPAHHTTVTPRFRATQAPIVRGRTRRGALLRTTSGRFTRRPVSLHYQWLRNGRSIRGAHASSYRLRRADVHKHIRVRVTARHSRTTVRTTSARTAAIRRR